jgi:hypothetical protein
MRDHARWNLLLGLTLVLLVAACGQQKSDQGGDAAEPAASEEAAAASGNNGDMNEDVAHAEELWQEIKDYESWPEPDGLEGWQEGESPHGAVLRYRVNNAARQDLGADGAVIVKANYSAQSDDALESLTVMEKREGYDPETGNWFYVKYSPGGAVAENPQGMKLAGLVGKGTDTGCIACHARAGGDDHVFMND